MFYRLAPRTRHPSSRVVNTADTGIWTPRGAMLDPRACGQACVPPASATGTSLGLHRGVCLRLLPKLAALFGTRLALPHPGPRLWFPPIKLARESHSLDGTASAALHRIPPPTGTHTPWGGAGGYAESGWRVLQETNLTVLWPGTVDDWLSRSSTQYTCSPKWGMAAMINFDKIIATGPSSAMASLPHQHPRPEFLFGLEVCMSKMLFQALGSVCVHVC